MTHHVMSYRIDALNRHVMSYRIDVLNRHFMSYMRSYVDQGMTFSEKAVTELYKSGELDELLNRVFSRE